MVVSAGINGMAAARLAAGGWSVAPVDGADAIGGFVATEERTLPGYRHDTTPPGTRRSSRGRCGTACAPASASSPVIVLG